MIVRFASGNTGKTASGDARNRESRSNGLDMDAHKPSTNRNAPTHARGAGKSNVANKSSNGRSGSFREKRDAAVLDQNKTDVTGATTMPGRTQLMGRIISTVSFLTSASCL